MLLWCLFAYLRPQSHNPNRVNIYYKPEYINEKKLANLSPPYGYKELHKIQE